MRKKLKRAARANLIERRKSEDSIPSTARIFFRNTQKLFLRTQREYIQKLLIENRERIQNAKVAESQMFLRTEQEVALSESGFGVPTRDEKSKLQLQRCRKVVLPHIEPLPASTAYIPIRRNFAGADILVSNVFVPFLGDTQKDIESAYQLLTAMDEIRQLQEDQHDECSNESSSGPLAVWRRGFNLGLGTPSELLPILECGSLSVMDATDAARLFQWMEEQKRNLFLIRETLRNFGDEPEILRALCVYASIGNADLESVLNKYHHDAFEQEHSHKQHLPADSELAATKSLLNDDPRTVIESDSMRSLFCRRCYSFDCAMHGSQQPLPTAKRPFFGLLDFRVREPSFCSDLCFSRFWPSSCAEMSHENSREAFLLMKKNFLETCRDSEKSSRAWTAVEVRLLETGKEIFMADFCRIRRACLPDRSCIECALRAFESDDESLLSQQARHAHQAMNSHEHSEEVVSFRKRADASIRAGSNDCSDSEMSGASAIHPEFSGPLAVTEMPSAQRTRPDGAIVQNREHSTSNSPPRRVRRHFYRPSTIRSYVYRPCNHEGSCVKANCICFSNGRFCEKYCCCSSRISGDLCPRAFKGCKCRTKCNNKKCPCFAADRECDPDICFSCGACAQPGEKRTCENMNLQLGIQRKLLLGRSEVHGWGIFARTMIPKGSFIGEYCGEVVSQLEAERRGRIHDHTTGVSYLFDLNDEQCIDAHRAGKRTKFINHSRAAPRKNCMVRYRIVNGDIRVALYADRQIEEGEELFFDYGYESSVNTPLWVHAESCDLRGTSTVPGRR